MKLNYIQDGKLVELKVKSCAPYAKGWQINATIDGAESEFTYYNTAKNSAVEQAKRAIARNGRLLNDPYKVSA
jgi:hypothetical protein